MKILISVNMENVLTPEGALFVTAMMVFGQLQLNKAAKVRRKN